MQYTLNNILINLITRFLYIRVMHLLENGITSLNGTLFIRGIGLEHMGASMEVGYNFCQGNFGKSKKRTSIELFINP